MLPVSAAFQTAAQATVRQPIKRVACWFEDNRSLASLVTLTVPGELDQALFPKSRIIDARNKAARRWALARGDCYPADDLYPIDEGWEGGWLSDTASGAGGVVSPAQDVVLEYVEAQEISTLEVWGDSWLGYPVDFAWYYWDEESSAYIELASVTANDQAYHSTALLSPVTTTKIKLSISKISRVNDYPALVEVQASAAADLTERVLSLTINKERTYRTQGSIALGNLAASELDLVLDNTDGAFFTGNEDSPYYGKIQPNNKLKVELGFVLADGSEEYCDAGVFYVTSWKSSAGAGQTTVRALDGWKLLQGQRYQGPVVEGSTISELAALVAAAGGVGASDMAIDPTTQVVPYAAFGDNTIFEHLRQLAIAEGGVVYFDESGILCFEGRDHLAEHTESAATIDQDTSVEDVTDETDEGPLVNRVRIKSARVKESAQATIWELQETVTVPASGTLALEVDWQGPAVDVQGPVITSGGAHVTVQSYDYDSRGGTVILANSGGADETVDGMTIAGRLLVADGQVVAEAADGAGMVRFGERAYALNNEYIQSLDHAQSLANDLLLAYDTFGAEVVVNMTARGLPHIQLGDKVAVKCSQAHIDRTGHVVRSSLVLDHGLSGELTVLTSGQSNLVGYVQGTVTMEGRTDYSGITVTPSAGGAAVETDSDGDFILPVLPRWVNITAHHASYLSAIKTDVLVVSQEVTDIGETELLAGDVNGDEDVGVTDLMMIRAKWLQYVDPETSPEDIDGDGRVTPLDEIWCLVNWTKTGPTEW